MGKLLQINQLLGRVHLAKITSEVAANVQYGMGYKVAKRNIEAI